MSFKTIIDNATGVVTQDGGQVTLPAATEQGQVLLANSAGSWTPYTWNPTFKNRIINGDMRVAQRGTGPFTLSGSTYTVDRMVAFKSNTTGGTVLAQQASVAPAGFSNSLRYYVTSVAPSVPAGDFIAIYQLLEGTNTYDFNWGSANARPITISFWVRSSVTGVYCMCIGTAGPVPRRYVAEYTVSTKDTWERKVITVPGDTAQSLLTSNTTSIAVNFDLGSGSSLITTAGSWQNSATLNRTANQVSFVTAPIVSPDTSNSFYLTGVQLELGSVATPFEMRPEQVELALCQRYYQRMTTWGGSTSPFFGAGVGVTTGTALIYIPYMQSMRSNPTLFISSTHVSHANGGQTVTGLGTVSYGEKTLAAIVNSSSTLVVGRAYVFGSANVTGGYVELTAEL